MIDDLVAKNKKLHDLFAAQSQECERLHNVQRAGAIVANTLADENAQLRALIADMLTLIDDTTVFAYDEFVTKAVDCMERAKAVGKEKEG